MEHTFLQETPPSCEEGGPARTAHKEQTWYFLLSTSRPDLDQVLSLLPFASSSSLLKFVFREAVHMAQWLKGLAAKPDDQSSMPRTYKEEAENGLSQVVF